MLEVAMLGRTCVLLFLDSRQRRGKGNEGPRRGRDDAICTALSMIEWLRTRPFGDFGFVPEDKSDTSELRRSQRRIRHEIGQRSSAEAVTTLVDFPLAPSAYFPANCV